MIRFIGPFILIGIAVTGFFMITNPLYKDVLQLREQMASYNEALDNSKVLENERDKLTKKYNAIDPGDLVKLQKLLPDNVDNIRLILEIEKIASPYGMILKDVKYDIISKSEAKNAGVIQPSEAQSQTKDYGTWSLEFSIQGSYNSFLNFLKDLENNLRIVDVSSIAFSSVSTGANLPLSDSYNYAFKIKTYWLRN